MEQNLPKVLVKKNCPPESGGQRGRVATTRGVVPITNLFGFGTTPALRVTPPDSGGEFILRSTTWFRPDVA